MVECPRRLSARSAGLAAVAVSDVTAKTVSVDRPFLSLRGVQGPAAPDDLDGLGGVREQQSRGHGRDLQGAAFDPAVPTFSGVVTDRDLIPGQCRELVVQTLDAPSWGAFALQGAGMWLTEAVPAP